jgi:Ring hydroxylating alpha subunit (catalytic domain)
VPEVEAGGQIATRPAPPGADLRFPDAEAALQEAQHRCVVERVRADVASAAPRRADDHRHAEAQPDRLALDKLVGGPGRGQRRDHVIEEAEPGLYRFPSAGRWWSANRTPLAPGFVTESMDGAPVAPPMGSYAGHDVGTLRVRTEPNFWCHASADHAVLTRLAPAGPELTRIRVQWLVDREAVEGRDYELERLLPFWRLTSEQDWNLCERNHAGVRNPAFIPGPYSRSREYNVIAFVEWYLGRVAGGAPGASSRLVVGG